MKTSNPLKRNKYSKNRPAFFTSMIPGDGLKDVISGVNAVTSISGTRYGIVNGVVTQFPVNQPPIEDAGLRGCPAFTQLALMSETLTDGSWGNSNLLTPVIVSTVQGKNIWDLTETTDPTVAHSIKNAELLSVSDNSVIGLSAVAKYKGRKLEIMGRLKDGSYQLMALVNLQTGLVSNIRSGSFVSCAAIGDGYYSVFASMPVGSGVANPRIYHQLNNGTTNIYTGDGVSGVYLGLPTIINFGVNGIPFIPPYVPNNTTGSVSVVSEAATATSGTSFDLDNTLLARLKNALRGPNAQGHLELTFKSNFDSGWLANDSYINILSFNNVLGATGGLALRKTAGGVLFWYFTDPVPNNAPIATAVNIGQVFKMSFDWGTHSTGQKMRSTINGIKSVLTNFSGSFGTQDLRFFYGNTVHAGWIVKDSLKIMDRPIW